MCNNSKPEEILNLEGHEGETIFWQLKSWLITDHTGDLQSHIDNMWEHYKDIDDERLSTVVGSLCTEISLDILLESYIECYNNLKKDTDITFSIKTKIAKALKLLPNKILNSCDLIRQIRNEFAHNLNITSFDQLESRYKNKLAPYIKEFNTAEQDWKDLHALYTLLVGFTIAGLKAYSIQLEKLKYYIKTEDFKDNFKKYTENK